MAFAGFDSPAYGTIAGALPRGAGANPVSALNSSDPVSSLANSYGANYQNALAMNRSNYNNIIGGYQDALRSQQAAQGGIGAGYGALSASVLGGIQGIGQSRNQSIMDEYAAAMGKQSQNLINHGLGNSTIASSVARGNLLDRTKALNENNERIAGLRAQHESSLGLQGLGAQREFYQNNTGLQNRQLDFMERVNAKYPDAGMYAGLASQYGNRGGAGGGGGFPGGGGTPGLGYAPRAAPGYYDSGRDPGVGGGGFGGMGAWAGSPTTGGGYGGYGATMGSGGGWSGYTGGAGGAGIGGTLGAAWGMMPSVLGGFGEQYGGGGDFGDLSASYGGGGDY